MLFLMSAGLTLVFGIMGLINLAHGSFYMVGAYVAAWVTGLTGSLLVGLLAALPAAMAVGMAIELLVMRRLYTRDHLDQVLATFGLILFFNEMARILFGRQPLFLDVPEMLSGTVEILPGVPYPAYRLAIIAVGILVAVGLWLLISKTRLGMRIRAGASDREMAAALGANVATLQTLVFGLGALLAGLAGAMAGPILAVESGMGEKILILAFVVIVIGGIGSVRGALVAALTVGLVDTLGRAFLPDLLRLITSEATADSLGATLSQVSIYLLMALVLAWKPKGLFPSHG
jgi:branched-chain amino acid transport system permease protein